MTAILGKSVATAEQMAAYLLSVNPSPKINMPVVQFCQLFLDESAKEGVRGDASFAQSCKETGNFKFQGTVIPGQNNYAGLGTTDASTRGAYFPDEATGILAQAQHLKGYATKEPLTCACVDPRYELLAKYGKTGTAPNWEDLGGKWAVPGYSTSKYSSLEEANKAKDSYGYQILAILDKILKMPKGGTNVATKIIALDAGHGMNTAGKRCHPSFDPNQTREWYLNDRIMDIVENNLKNYDCTVLRVDDTTGAKDIALATRVKMANDANADIYVSMHHNAGLNGRKGGGTVVYYYSSNAERPKQAQKLYEAIVSRTKLVGNRSQKVMKNAFYVLKNTKAKSFLVENGFMDGPDDVPTILSQAHAEKTAEGVLWFLVDELGLKKKNTTTSSNQTAPAQTTSANTYTVKAGDTLSKIGKKTGIAWKEIADLNGIKSPYHIRVGQVLKLKNDYYPAYTGKKVTLTAALTSLGITSTYAFRQKIAAANNITAYVGSVSQNTQMYNLLVAGLLKRA